jgi:hypothetical protein
MLLTFVWGLVQWNMTTVNLFKNPKIFYWKLVVSEEHNFNHEYDNWFNFFNIAF